MHIYIHPYVLLYRFVEAAYPSIGKKTPFGIPLDQPYLKPLLDAIIPVRFMWPVCVYATYVCVCTYIVCLCMYTDPYTQSKV